MSIVFAGWRGRCLMIDFIFQLFFFIFSIVIRPRDSVIENRLLIFHFFNKKKLTSCRAQNRGYEVCSTPLFYKRFTAYKSNSSVFFMAFMDINVKNKNGNVLIIGP